MAKDRDPSTDAPLESLRKALIRHYKSEIERGTVCRERRDWVKRWLAAQSTPHAVDDLWELPSAKLFIPPAKSPQPFMQESDPPSPPFDSPRSSRKADSRGRARIMWSSPPRKPPSIESGADPGSDEWNESAKGKEDDGTYVHSYFDHVQGAVSFNKAPRPAFFPTKDETPGPAYYHVSDTRLRSQSPRTVIARSGSRLEKWGSSDTPGPGHYSPRLRIVHN